MSVVTACDQCGYVSVRPEEGDTDYSYCDLEGAVRAQLDRHDEVHEKRIRFFKQRGYTPTHPRERPRIARRARQLLDSIHQEDQIEGALLILRLGYDRGLTLAADSDTPIGSFDMVVREHAYQSRWPMAVGSEIDRRGAYGELGSVPGPSRWVHDSLRGS